MTSQTCCKSDKPANYMGWSGTACWVEQPSEHKARHGHTSARLACSGCSAASMWTMTELVKSSSQVATSHQFGTPMAAPLPCRAQLAGIWISVPAKPRCMRSAVHVLATMGISICEGHALCAETLSRDKDRVWGQRRASQCMKQGASVSVACCRHRLSANPPRSPVSSLTSSGTATTPARQVGLSCSANSHFALQQDA